MSGPRRDSTSGSTGLGGPGEPPTGELGYADALAELEGILHELEGDAVDVDHLGERVRRAAELIRLCRGRIDHARMEIEQVVAELDTNP
jgi:exodeoxyribonuclease VII small subunit